MLHNGVTGHNPCLLLCNSPNFVSNVHALSQVAMTLGLFDSHHLNQFTRCSNGALWTMPLISKESQKVQGWFTIFLHVPYRRWQNIVQACWCKAADNEAHGRKHHWNHAYTCLLYLSNARCAYASVADHTCSLGPLKMTWMALFRRSKHNACIVSAPRHLFRVSRCACTKEINWAVQFL